MEVMKRFGLVAVAVLVGSCSGQIGSPSAQRSGGAAPDLGSPGDVSDPSSQDNASCPWAATAVSASDGWQSRSASEPVFDTLYFEVTARMVGDSGDALVAIGAEDIADFADAAVKVRFAGDGFLDARDGSVYDKDLSIAYEQGVWYTFGVWANVATRTYDVEVARCGEFPQALITDAAFESDSSVSDRLTTWGAWSSHGAKLDLSTPSWITSDDCAVATCDSLGLTCGVASDGCGGTLNCGGCNSGESCEVGVCIQDPVAPPPLPTDGDPDRPWAHNTGPTDPGALTGSGSLTITTDGAVVEDINVTGSVKIDANNVTLRNFKIHNALYAIQIVPGHSGILIEDGEIYDVRTGVYGAGFTARRLYIHDVQTDAMKVSGAGGPTLVEYCFIERIGIEELSHADGNQCVGGSNITFRYNNIWVPLVGPDYPGAPYKANAAFQNQNTISNFVIEYNWLNGGGYTVYCGKDGSRGVSVRYNRFGRGMRFGPISGNCDQKVGNVWDDTGGPI